MLKVISGGQTGADLAGLAAAKTFGLVTGGYAPRGFKTQMGDQPVLGTVFNLEETRLRVYSERTEMNVQLADATLIVGSNLKSSGSASTIKLCKEYDKRYLIILFDPSSSVEEFLSDQHNIELIDVFSNALKLHGVFHKAVTLNVAGNSSSTSSRAFDFTYAVCCRIFEKFATHKPSLSVSEILGDVAILRDNYLHFETTNSKYL